jgi:putative peptidoglycan binding protein/L,D-transpeptidase-like protein
MSHTVLFRGMPKSPEVGVLQAHLNRCSPTHLPRLAKDNDFGVMTKARVMEFQSQHHIPADGIVTTTTFKAIGNASSVVRHTTTPHGRAIVVNLVNNNLRVFDHGSLIMTIRPIHGGSSEDPSTQGVFPMTSRRLRHHTSAEFPEPPDNMQFAMFYHKGQAIHMGPGDEPSHGCIHVDFPAIEKLFNFVGSSNVLVIVVKP